MKRKRLINSLLLIVGALSALYLFNHKIVLAQGQVAATVETDPVPDKGDAADDPAIWIHPTDPSKSTIIGTNKRGGLEVYDLAGNKLQVVPLATGNVDLRYNFPLDGQKVALVTGYSMSDGGGMFAFKVNPQTRLLEDVVAGKVKVGGGGSAMYHSPITDKFYLFQNSGAELRQYELFDNGQGKVDAREVRTVSYGKSNKSEGVVADDVWGHVYVSEETKGIWRLGAEPNAGSAHVQVDKVISQGGHLKPDVEGVTIYYKSDKTGYLIASSQGNNTYTVYRRGCNNDYLGAFRIRAGSLGDQVTGTDGIDVTNFPLGSKFPGGLFIAQDHSNSNPDGNQNFKLVPWEAIVNAFNPLLTTDLTWDPRKLRGKSAAWTCSDDRGSSS
jgi:3-phytase